MTYRRVIPRDLFNEANLLKCYGQVYLQLEYLDLHRCLIYDADGLEAFNIVQNPEDGSTTILNVGLIIGRCSIHFRRPLNSRDPFPLYAWLAGSEDEVPVFEDDGTFTREMKLLLEDAVSTL